MTFIDGRAPRITPDFKSSGITPKDLNSITNFINDRIAGMEKSGAVEPSSLYSAKPQQMSPEKSIGQINFDQDQSQAQANMTRNLLGL